MIPAVTLPATPPVHAHHFIPAPPVIKTENETVEFEDESPDKYMKCVGDIQSIFAKGYTPENGKILVDYVQKQRTLILELMLQQFMKRPDPKMGDSLNTLMGQIEKSVRDDRKEALKAKEMETSKETFELFAKSLSAVIDGKISIPTFGASSLLLDPLQTLIDPLKAKIKPEELVQGNVLVNDKEIEATILAEKQQTQGTEIALPPAK